MSGGSVTAALVLNSIAIVMCCSPFAVAGVITALHAQRRLPNDPRSARKMLIWSWSLFAVALVLGIVVGVLYFALGLDTDSSSGY